MNMHSLTARSMFCVLKAQTGVQSVHRPTMQTAAESLVVYRACTRRQAMTTSTSPLRGAERNCWHCATSEHMSASLPSRSVVALLHIPAASLAGPGRVCSHLPERVNVYWLIRCSIARPPRQIRPLSKATLARSAGRQARMSPTRSLS